MRNRILSMIVGVLILSCALFSGYNVELITETSRSTQFDIEFQEPVFRHIGDNIYFIESKGFSPRGEENGPRLYGRSFNLAIPRGSSVEVNTKSINWSKWYDIIPVSNNSTTLITGKSGPMDATLYSQRCGGEIEFSSRFVIRGVEIAAVDVIPVQYDPDLGVRFIEKASIEVIHHGGGSKSCDARLYSPVFEKMYRAMLINPESAVPRNRPCTPLEWDPTDGAELLVIVRPDFEDELQPWIDWKLFMGLPTLVYTTTETGTDTASIKSFIQDAYDTWTMPPTYVLLAADADYIPAISGSGGLTGDNNYCIVDGSDYFPDIFPGRMSADYSSHMETIVQKHLNYEKQPDMSEQWYTRAVGIVNEDDPDWDPLGPQDSSYLAAVTYGMGQCSGAGFISSPVFRRADGDGFSDVSPHVRNGLNIIQYRGQAWPDYYYGFSGGLDTLYADGICNINISITCGTGGFNSGDSRMCERSTRRGTTTHPAGACAFMGQALVSSNSEERSSLSKHIFEGLFEEELNQLGAAHTYGKNGMYSEFGGIYESTYEYKNSVLIGSPDMLVWTAPIEYPSVTAPPAVDEGVVDVPISVMASGVGVENARVTIHQGPDFTYGMTNASGNVTLNVDASPTDPLYLVVTGPNIYPYCDTIEVVIGGVGIYCSPVQYIDIVGDGDNLLNPGETISFTPKICNLGSEGTGGLTAMARCSDPSIVFIDSTTSFPYIAPDDTVEGDEIVFQIPSDHPEVDDITIYLNISGHPDGPWLRGVTPYPAIYRFRTSYETYTIDDPTPYGDGDGELDPGEVANVCVSISNNTLADGYNVMGTLMENSLINPIQPYSIIDTVYRSTSRQFDPCFTISVNPMATPGADASAGLIISGEGSIYSFIDTLTVPLVIQGEVSQLPVGPDSYGYYIIDDTDIDCGLAPTYIWNDISSVGTELDGVSDADDAVMTIGLPFDMTYYGIDYDSITVASNGYICPGRDNYSGGGTGYPDGFPDSGGPEGVVAPAWADLAPHRHDGGEIYGYYDVANNQVVIQWDECDFYYGGGYITCQLRICDPTEYPTPTGDSEIYIYYGDLSGIAVMGTGMESESETIGLEYYLDGVYNINAAPLGNERALRITTIEPATPSMPWLYYLDLFSLDDSSGNNNGIVEPGEEIRVRLRVKNGGEATAPSVTGEVLPTAMLSPTGSAGSFGSISVGNTGYNLSSPINFVISSSCPSDTMLELPIEFSALGGFYTTVMRFYLWVGESIGIIEEKQNLPEGVSLGNPYPNPFNSSVSIDVSVGIDADKDIIADIYDLNGRKITRLIEGRLTPGTHKVHFEADNMSSGIYFLRLSYDGDYKLRKMILIE